MPTVTDLFLGRHDAFKKTSGNVLIDTFLDREVEADRLMSNWKTLADYHPDLAQDIRDATPETLGDLLARSVVIMHHCRVYPAWGDSHDFGKHLGFGEAVYILAKAVVAERRAVLTAEHGTIALTILCDPDGSAPLHTPVRDNDVDGWDLSDARDERDPNVVGLSKAWEAPTLLAFPMAVLDGLMHLKDAPLDVSLSDVLVQITARWDRDDMMIGPSVAVLRQKVAELRGEAPTLKHERLSRELLAQAQGDELLIKLMELAGEPLICKALASDSHKNRNGIEEDAKRGGVSMDLSSKIEATEDKERRASLIAASCRVSTYARENLPPNRYGGVSAHYGIGIIYHATVWTLGRKPNTFTVSQALEILNGLEDARQPGLIRDVLRGADVDDADFAPAVEGLIQRTELRAKNDPKARKCIDVLNASLDSTRKPENAGSESDALKAGLEDMLDILTLLHPANYEDPLRWHKDAKATLRNDVYQAVAEEVTRRTAYDAPPGIKENRQEWVQFTGLKEQREVTLNRILADTVRLARYGQDTQAILDRVLELGEARASYWDNPANKKTHYERYFGTSGNVSYAGEQVDINAFQQTITALRSRSAFYLALNTVTRDVFVRLEAFCAEAPGGSKPSEALREKAKAALSSADRAIAMDHLESFLASTDPGLPKPALPHHELADAPLLGLVWMMGDWPADVVAPILTSYAMRCFVTEPGRGIRAEKIGNGCLWALQALPDGLGTPYLARIAARVRYPKIKKKIDAALNAAAEAAGVQRAELDEMIVPNHGLQGGALRISTPYGAAIIEVDQATALLRWENAEGKTVNSPPKAMKDNAAEDTKAARAMRKEISADLGAQMKRIDRLPLTGRQIPPNEFRERYLDHPLIGSACRALIWAIGDRLALYDAGSMCDLDGAEVSLDAAVSLWHPVESDPKIVIAWRDRLEHRALVQPIKQAWREVYVVTDAERATGHYSNRFAAHIVKQHQTITLARTNGWRATHRMAVDAPNDDPLWTAFPEFGVYVEFWTAAPGYDSETTETGSFLYLHTDRILFHHLDGDPATQGPLALRGAQLETSVVPPVVFSEVMRHADLIVAVASLASDPDWYDRGRDAAHPSPWEDDARHYFETATSADLTGAGKIRKEALERVLPKLKIADRVGIDDRYVTVQGVLRSYRIHIGSASVQRNPDGRHVCIVPKQRAAKFDDIRLPFEGDLTLSLVLSKALLLAADDKIEDEVILSQL